MSAEAASDACGRELCLFRRRCSPFVAPDVNIVAEHEVQPGSGPEGPDSRA